MKISKSIQRRTIVLMVFVALFAIFQIAHFTTQIIYTSNPYNAEKGFTNIGTLDTSLKVSDITSGKYDEFAVTIERDTDGEPLVEALPITMMLFSVNPDYSLPDHYGWKANRVVGYLTLLLLVVMEIIIGWILLSAIRGFRTGNIFSALYSRLLRYLAVIAFFYYALVENRTLFTQLAAGDIYGDKMAIDLYSSLTLNVEVFMIPLLLLIFAELMAIAARMNEDETMTI